MIEAVLFDLDGTLIDTAADMGAALNNLRLEEGLPSLALETIRPHVSQGGLALTQLGFAEQADTVAIASLLQRYLKHYRSIIAHNSALFSGFEQILQTLQNQQIAWGIVTNKPTWLTTPLLKELQISSPVVICGDTLEQRKPHPLPLQTAAKRLGISCQKCLYVGDDERDIIAGKAANMKTLIAAYGYIRPDADIHAWQADGILQTPLDLLNHPLLSVT